MNYSLFRLTSTKCLSILCLIAAIVTASCGDCETECPPGAELDADSCSCSTANRYIEFSLAVNSGSYSSWESNDVTGGFEGSERFGLQATFASESDAILNLTIESIDSMPIRAWDTIVFDGFNSFVDFCLEFEGQPVCFTNILTGELIVSHADYTASSLSSGDFEFEVLSDLEDTLRVTSGRFNYSD